MAGTPMAARLTYIAAVLIATPCAIPLCRSADNQLVGGNAFETLEVQHPTVQLKAFMRKKLAASEQIMEGLTMPDYGLIRKGATTMIHMSKEAIWETQGGAVYTQDSVDFVRSAERLIKLSNQKDLEGASHTYAKLTIQCVDCHRRVRSEKVVSAMRTPPGLAALD